MCFHSQQSKTAQELKHRFRVDFKDEASFTPMVYNGFEHPQTPVITNEQPNTIQLYNWGLLPHWAKDTNKRNSTLNARIESITEKPSFRDVTNNRCLLLVDGFYEWQWLDTKGKNKQKYLITLPNNEAFAIAGLWSHWTNPLTGEILKTYTVLTTEANELMSRIHNSQKRMPLILTKDKERDWLTLPGFETLAGLNLNATKVEPFIMVPGTFNYELRITHY
jgi:putative SOS response-associated peptidase YedK